MKSRRESLDL